MGLSRSAIPPLICLAGFGRVCRLIIDTCSTRTLPLAGFTSSTRPVLPLSRPAITFTWSFFFCKIRTGSASFFFGISNHLGRQGHDLHESLFAQFPGHGSEHARAHRLAQLGDQHCGIGIEPDIRAVLAPGLLAHAHDHAAHHFTLLDRGIRSRFFHAGRNHVAQAGPQAEVAAARQNARQTARAAVVGYLQDRSHPYHGRYAPGGQGAGVLFSPSPQTLVPNPYTFTSNSSGCTPTCGARLTTSLTRRHSITRTMSPTLARPSSSCAWNFLRFFTIRLYSGCGTRRLTSTTIVLAVLVETTWPTFSFFNGFCVCSAILLIRSRQFPFSHDGVDTGAVFLHGARLFQAFHGAHRHLEIQPEKLLLDGAQLMLQLVLVEVLNLLRLHGLLRLLPRYEFGTDGQLVGRQPHGIGRHIRRHAFHLEQNLARPHHRHPLLRRAFALSHTGLGGLLGDGLIREQTNPYFAAALDGAGHGDTRGLDLPVGDPGATHGLEAILAESDGRTPPRLATHPAALLLAVFDLLRHHHGLLLSFRRPVCGRRCGRRRGRRFGCGRGLGLRLDIRAYFLFPMRLRRHERRQDRPTAARRMRHLGRRRLPGRSAGFGRGRRWWFVVPRRWRPPVATIATVPAAIAPVAAVATVAPGFRFRRQRLHAVAGVQDLALVEPRFHADHAIRRMGFRKTVIDIRAQRVQRKLALQIPFAARGYRL